jgi:hypothetical protein
MQGAVTPDGLALFAAFVRLLPLVTGCNRPILLKKPASNSAPEKYTPEIEI